MHKQQAIMWATVVLPVQVSGCCSCNLPAVRLHSRVKLDMLLLQAHWLLFAPEAS
jgi:hypothetical protein